MDGEQRITLRLLGGFELVGERGPLDVPEATRKVIAFIALQARPAARAVVAAQLWPDKSEQRAAANLRSALWRLRGGDMPELIGTSSAELALRPSVGLDVRLLRQAAAGLDAPAATNGNGSGPHRELADDILFEPLLPGWNDAWVVIERERLAQAQLHLLDGLVAGLVGTDQAARAIDLALRLVALDPLRERSQCGLVAAYAAEGSIGHAQRQWDRYRELVERSTGGPPRLSFEQASGLARRDSLPAR